MTTNTVIDHNKLAKNWLIGGGLAAIALVAFLIWADDYLTNSNKEKVLNDLLFEIRTAQTSMPSRN